MRAPAALGRPNGFTGAGWWDQGQGQQFGNPNPGPNTSPWARWGNSFGGNTEWQRFSSLGREGLGDWLLKGAFPGMMNQALFQSEYLQPQFERGIMQLIGLTSPAGAQARAAGVRDALTNQAMTMGNRNAAQLSAAGYAPGTQMAARVDAMNKANMAGFDATRQITDPMAANQALLQALGMGGQGLPSPMMGAILAPQQQQPGQPTFFQQLMGGLTGLASGGAFNKLFK